MSASNELELLGLLTARLLALESQFSVLAKQPGPDGEQGVQGAPGEQGVAGVAGEQGQAGVPGPAGARGTKGEKGEKGDVGPPGEKGDVGPAPKHRWINTSLQFQQPNGQWGTLTDLRGKPGMNGGVSGGGGFGAGGTDLDSLPAGDPLVMPEEIALKQDGEWVRITWADFLTMVGSQTPLDPDQVTVNGVGMTINGAPVLISGSTQQDMTVDGQPLTIDGQQVVIG